MIFGKLKVEKIIQVDDKTRIDCTRSFVVDETSAITLMRVKPSVTDSFIDITANKYLDWSYSLAGINAIELEITTDGAPQVFAAKLTSISVADDYLFSSDADITPHEDDILNYVIAGRDSFLDKHRVAQERVMTYLNDQRIWDESGSKLSPSAIVNIDEVRDWSKFQTLAIIFEGISNQVGDIFSVKAEKYKGLMERSRASAALRLDRSGDGNEDSNIEIKAMRIIIR